jgi:hypothetical protein
MLKVWHGNYDGCQSIVIDDEDAAFGTKDSQMLKKLGLYFEFVEKREGARESVQDLLKFISLKGESNQSHCCI